jgi:hypothetical protein
VTEPLEQLINPDRVWSRPDVLCSPLPCPVPAQAGVYGWYFRELPGDLDATACEQFSGMHLLYVGISPRRPTPAGGQSKRNLRLRIRSHYKGNANASTLRMTLGCLLQERLGIALGLSDSGRLTFGPSGEDYLSDWMTENAFVVWAVTSEPWNLEDLAIQRLNLPLNLRDNQHHAFHSVLSETRRTARLRAHSAS